MLIVATSESNATDSAIGMATPFCRAAQSTDIPRLYMFATLEGLPIYNRLQELEVTFKKWCVMSMINFVISRQRDLLRTWQRYQT